MIVASRVDKDPLKTKIKSIQVSHLYSYLSCMFNKLLIPHAVCTFECCMRDVKQAALYIYRCCVDSRNRSVKLVTSALGRKLALSEIQCSESSLADSHISGRWG